MVFEPSNGVKPIKIIEYRQYIIPVYYNEDGQFYSADIDGKNVNFGSFNTEYENDIKYLIDKKLDLIYEFPEYKYTRLEWFLNGSFRDIRLVLGGRILKVFLVQEPSEVSIEKLKKESLRILKIVNLATRNTV